MKYLVTLFTFCLFTALVYGQQPNIPKEVSCQNNWTCAKLDTSFTGTILFHETARAFCGVVATASVSIILKGNGDTIRVLELCNLTKKFKKGTIVTITPDIVPPFGVGLFAIDPLACRLMTTYFGNLEESKNNKRTHNKILPKWG